MLADHGSCGAQVTHDVSEEDRLQLDPVVAPVLAACAADDLAHLVEQLARALGLPYRQHVVRQVVQGAKRALVVLGLDGRGQSLLEHLRLRAPLRRRCRGASTPCSRARLPAERPKDRDLRQPSPRPPIRLRRRVAFEHRGFGGEVRHPGPVLTRGQALRDLERLVHRLAVGFGVLGLPPQSRRGIGAPVRAKASSDRSDA